MFFSNEPQDRQLHLLDEQVAVGLKGDFARGWEIAQVLERQDPDCHRAAFNRGWYYMMRGDLLHGLELLDRGRWVSAFGDKPLPTSKPIWRNENVNGKFVLICSEGGLGDEIINARFALDFINMGAKVTLTCDPGLASVFSRIEGISSVIGHKRSPEVYHDFWVPGMSAGRVLGYTYKKLSGKPYLFVHPDYKQKWQNKLSRNPAKIGLRFYGNPKFEHEQHRRFPIQGLINTLKGRPWLNLQIEETDLSLDSWEDTLAVLDHLDLVITSCTSVAHAAAAMGKKTWVIVPVMPYYTWALPGDRSPWYDSVRIFRQTQFGVWNDVFLRIEQALDEEFA